MCSLLPHTVGLHLHSTEQTSSQCHSKELNSTGSKNKAGVTNQLYKQKNMYGESFSNFPIFNFIQYFTLQLHLAPL